MSERSEQVTLLLDQATGLYREEKYAEALEVYQQAQELSPEDADVLLGVATSHVKLGQAQSGLKAFTQALNLYPENRRHSLRQGFSRLLSRQSAYHEAVEVLAPMLAENATEENILMTLQATIKSDQWGETEGLLREYLVHNPGLWEKLLDSEEISDQERQRLMSIEGSLVKLIRDQLAGSWQEESPRYLDIIHKYGEDQPEFQEIVTRWKTLNEELENSEEIRETLGLTAKVKDSWKTLKSAAFSSLEHFFRNELDQEKQLITCFRAVSGSINERDLPSSVKSWLSEISNNEADRKRPEKAEEAFLTLKLLLERGSNVLPDVEESLLSNLRKRVADSHALGGGKYLRLLEEYFPGSEELPGLKKQLERQAE